MNLLTVSLGQQGQSKSLWSQSVHIAHNETYQPPLPELTQGWACRPARRKAGNGAESGLTVNF